MNEKTRTEYETLKAAWSKLPGVVEDVVQREQGTNREYRYLTLTEDVPRDIATVCGVLMRLGTIAVQTEASFSMWVMEDHVEVRIAVATYEVDLSLAAQGVTPGEVLAEEVDDHACPCGELDGKPHGHEVQGGM